MKKLLRTLQTYFPGSADIKYYLQYKCRTILNTPFDKDFEVLKHFVPPSGTVFLDVGANRGQSIAAMRLFHPDIPIVAFEPRKETYRRLKSNTHRLGNLQLIHGGLSDEAGRFTLYTPMYRGYVFDGLASTIRAEAEGWLNAERLYFFDSSRLAIQREEVALAPLDSHGLSPSFIKLDVQGAEARVLRGGLGTIAAHTPIILAEQSPGCVLEEILAPLGYAAYRYERKALRRGVRGRTNALFVPEGRKADLALPVE